MPTGGLWWPLQRRQTLRGEGSSQEGKLEGTAVVQVSDKGGWTPLEAEKELHFAVFSSIFFLAIINTVATNASFPHSKVKTLFICVSLIRTLQASLSVRGKPHPSYVWVSLPQPSPRLFSAPARWLLGRHHLRLWALRRLHTALELYCLTGHHLSRTLLIYFLSVSLRQPGCKLFEGKDCRLSCP